MGYDPRVQWQDPDQWGTWDMCSWSAQHSHQGAAWSCLLPLGHTGPHLGLASWETAPYHVDNRVEKNGVWVEGQVCSFCVRRHPGFRHANDTDAVVITQTIGDEEWWEPQPLTSKMGDWRELFVPTFDPFVPLPIPPKFNTIEEADAWLEQHSPL